MEELLRKIVEALSKQIPEREADELRAELDKWLGIDVVESVPAPAVVSATVATTTTANPTVTS